MFDYTLHYSALLLSIISILKCWYTSCALATDIWRSVDVAGAMRTPQPAPKCRRRRKTPFRDTWNSKSSTCSHSLFFKIDSCSRNSDFFLRFCMFLFMNFLRGILTCSDSGCDHHRCWSDWQFDCHWAVSQRMVRIWVWDPNNTTRKQLPLGEFNVTTGMSCW